MNLEALLEIMTDCLLNLKWADSKIDNDDAANRQQVPDWRAS